jgi:hypothetical protein
MAVFVQILQKYATLSTIAAVARALLFTWSAVARALFFTWLAVATLRVKKKLEVF